MPDIMASLPEPDKPKQSLFRWFFTTQFVLEKAPVWKALFMNKVTITFVIFYGYQLYQRIEIDEHFTLLLGMILGYYFKSDSKDNGGQ